MNTKVSISWLAAALSILMLSLPLHASELDDKIESSAKQSYVFKTYLDESIEVDSNEGVVTLSGIVNDASFVALAEDTVIGLPGVHSVNNQLTVRELTPILDSDAWLVTKVKSTLLFHRNVSALTSVSAQDGVITLNGVANSLAEKDLTETYAMDIEGVTKVVNAMTINPSPIEKKSSLGEQIDDASITAQVKMVLLSHRSTSALRTSVETRDGVVTLSGVAKNGAEVDLATNIITSTKGVLQVINIMTVEK
tara:strand:- start:1134 stop:1889 length:756 start_codon:yes stop_codon:yes gene_type:complete